jgi:hypothetical protein
MTFNTTRFHNDFDATVEAIMEPVREALLEGSGEATREAIVAQLMMENLFPHPCEPGNDGDGFFSGRLTREQKVTLVSVAEHMGPDWTQALYHATVFMTKVA